MGPVRQAGSEWTRSLISCGYKTGRMGIGTLHQVDYHNQTVTPTTKSVTVKTGGGRG